jgi:hypothetical protein
VFHPDLVGIQVRACSGWGARRAGGLAKTAWTELARPHGGRELKNGEMPVNTEDFGMTVASGALR